ncbi:hypothetical protein TNCV_896771 [Trichonephila clavipes]|nr:hypothetical protein TNCV_896771 [Trichonephila clavipes]
MLRPVDRREPIWFGFRKAFHTPLWLLTVQMITIMQVCFLQWLNNATYCRTEKLPTMDSCANLNPCDVPYLPIKFVRIILEHPA